MKLPRRDYPIGHMTAEELENDAARLVREAVNVPHGKTPDAQARNRRKRGLALYGAIYLKVAATRMRKRSANTFNDLTERDRRKVEKQTDQHAKRGTPIEDIY